MGDIFTQIADDLKSDEGWVPHAYQDHLGFWTLGYGFLIDKRRNGRIPQPVADYWLNWEMDQIWERLSAHLEWFDGAPEQIQRAQVNMAYQLGVSGLLRFRNTLTAIEQRDYAAGASHAMDSRWATQTPNRAQRVAGWIRSAA